MTVKFAKGTSVIVTLKGTLVSDVADTDPDPAFLRADDGSFFTAPIAALSLPPAEPAPVVDPPAAPVVPTADALASLSTPPSLLAGLREIVDGVASKAHKAADAIAAEAEKAVAAIDPGEPVAELEPAQVTPQFGLGDLVALKCGGPTMIVGRQWAPYGEDEDFIFCQWINDAGMPQACPYDPAMLVHVTPASTLAAPPKAA